MRRRLPDRKGQGNGAVLVGTKPLVSGFLSPRAVRNDSTDSDREVFERGEAVKSSSRDLN